jgi:hypothetical protein
MDCLFSDLDTTGGAEGLLDVAVDSELTSSLGNSLLALSALQSCNAKAHQSSDHEKTSTNASIAALEA